MNLLSFYFLSYFAGLRVICMLHVLKHLLMLGILDDFRAAQVVFMTCLRSILRLERPSWATYLGLFLSINKEPPYSLFRVNDMPGNDMLNNGAS